MGIPIPILVMIFLMVSMFGVAVFWMLAKKTPSLKQTVDPKPTQTFTDTKDHES